jgi:hypothetical protein
VHYGGQGCEKASQRKAWETPEVIARRKRWRALVVGVGFGAVVAALAACSGGSVHRATDAQRLTEMLGQTQAALRLEGPVTTVTTRRCKGGTYTAIFARYPRLTARSAAVAVVTNGSRFFLAHAQTWGRATIQASAIVVDVDVSGYWLIIDYDPTLKPQQLTVGGTTPCEVKRSGHVSPTGE